MNMNRKSWAGEKRCEKRTYLNLEGVLLPTIKLNFFVLVLGSIGGLMC